VLGLGAMGAGGAETGGGVGAVCSCTGNGSGEGAMGGGVGGTVSDAVPPTCWMWVPGAATGWIFPVPSVNGAVSGTGVGAATGTSAGAAGEIGVVPRGGAPGCDDFGAPSMIGAGLGPASGGVGETGAAVDGIVGGMACEAGSGAGSGVRVNTLRGSDDEVLSCMGEGSGRS
jgi:hypothetical protein